MGLFDFITGKALEHLVDNRSIPVGYKGGLSVCEGFGIANIPLKDVKKIEQWIKAGSIETAKKLENKILESTRYKLGMYALGLYVARIDGNINEQELNVLNEIAGNVSEFWQKNTLESYKYKEIYENTPEFNTIFGEFLYDLLDEEIAIVDEYVRKMIYADGEPTSQERNFYEREWEPYMQIHGLVKIYPNNVNNDCAEDVADDDLKARKLLGKAKEFYSRNEFSEGYMCVADILVNYPYSPICEEARRLSDEMEAKKDYLNEVGAKELLDKAIKYYAQNDYKNGDDCVNAFYDHGNYIFTSAFTEAQTLMEMKQRERKPFVSRLIAQAKDCYMNGDIDKGNDIVMQIYDIGDDDDVDVARCIRNMYNGYI